LGSARSFLEASPRLLGGFPEASPRLPGSFPEASPRLLGGFPERGFPEASGRLSLALRRVSRGFLVGLSASWLAQPSNQPSNHPTNQPANQPTVQPSNQPTNSVSFSQKVELRLCWDNCVSLRTIVINSFFEPIFQRVSATRPRQSLHNSSCSWLTPQRVRKRFAEQ
jgi:hypothetical protein